ncbi:hypothetical protein J2736_003513 [Paenibacillus qinlingensis]|uniref:Uncharacterized protein n=1 Tax=Paenibacillus qinlingensis TaxID=1837343 RepID=A0ABU1NXT6_9BACL|nr:hypothetical protein [Paenibacillus qinlingensis]
MEKKGQAKIDIMEILVQTGINPNDFLVFAEHELEKPTFINLGTVQHVQRQ